jgi:hypothetical protein
MNQKDSGSEKPGPLKRGRPTRKQQKIIKPILEQYYHSGKPAYQVAEELGYNRKTVNRYFRKFYKATIKKMDEEFIENLKKSR